MTTNDDVVTECKHCDRYWVPRIHGPIEGQPCPACGNPVVARPRRLRDEPCPAGPMGGQLTDPLVGAFNNYDKLHKLTEQIRAENALLVELTERQRRLVDAYEQALERIANEHRWAQEDYRHFASAVLGKAKE